jgi:hypothetical protein
MFDQPSNAKKKKIRHHFPIEYSLTLAYVQDSSIERCSSKKGTNTSTKIIEHHQMTSPMFLYLDTE